MKPAPEVTSPRVVLWPVVRALHFRPLFADQPMLVGGYTRDEIWVCTIDARAPDDFAGIHGHFRIGPSTMHHCEQLPNLTEAKKWAQSTWQEMVRGWQRPNTKAEPDGQSL